MDGVQLLQVLSAILGIIVVAGVLASAFIVVTKTNFLKTAGDATKLLESHIVGLKMERDAMEARCKASEDQLNIYKNKPSMEKMLDFMQKDREIQGKHWKAVREDMQKHYEIFERRISEHSAAELEALKAINAALLGLAQAFNVAGAEGIDILKHGDN